MKKILIFSALVFLTSNISTGENFNLIPTGLRVTILDNLGNLVEGATVVVFGKEEDYRFEKNPVAGPELTDARGRVTFKPIMPKSYYIYVVKGDKNNNGEGVRTSRLSPNKMNKINIIIR